MTATGTREGGLDDTVQVVTRVYQHPDEAQELMLKLSGIKAKTIANATPKLPWRVHEDGDSVSVPAFAAHCAFMRRVSPPAHDQSSTCWRTWAPGWCRE